MAKRASLEEIEERIESLREWRDELELKGKRLTVSMIQKRFGISKSQAARYRRRIYETTQSRGLGKAIASGILKSAPLVLSTLRKDLELLNRMDGESNQENASLIKSRRDQALTISKIETQVLKDIRELLLLSEGSNNPERKVASENIEFPQNSEIDPTLLKEAEQELLDFDDELTREASK